MHHIGGKILKKQKKKSNISRTSKESRRGCIYQGCAQYVQQASMIDRWVGCAGKSNQAWSCFQTKPGSSTFTGKDDQLGNVVEVANNLFGVVIGLSKLVRIFITLHPQSPLHGTPLLSPFYSLALSLSPAAVFDLAVQWRSDAGLSLQLCASRL